jgi:hypothetical protein
VVEVVHISRALLTLEEVNGEAEVGIPWKDNSLIGAEEGAIVAGPLKIINAVDADAALEKD